MSGGEQSLQPKKSPESVDISAPLSAFKEVVVVQPTPVVQMSWIYNINSRISTERSNNGSATAANGSLTLSTGAAANQSSAILSVDPVKYAPGQGIRYRGTALFTTGVANSEQVIGIGDAFEGFFFGYDGADFGVLRRRGGQPEIRTLTITTASSTAENITVTLNGDADATVAVTASGVIGTTVNEIAAHDYSDLGTGWDAYAVGDDVVFVSWSDSAKSGTYSISGTTVVGAFVQDVAGVTAVDTWIAQTAWSEDKMDGSGPSGVTLDQTKGNVYQISFQWLGYGCIAFGIENPSTGRIDPVHLIEYSNAQTETSIENPTLPLFGQVKNGSNTTDITMNMGSMGGFIEGIARPIGPTTGIGSSSVAVGTTEIPILSVRSNVVHQGQLNRVPTHPEYFSLSTDSNKNITFRVYEDADLIGASFADLDAETSTLQKDVAATSFSGGRELFDIELGRVDSLVVKIDQTTEVIRPAEILTITAQVSTGGGAGNTANFSVHVVELF